MTELSADWPEQYHDWLQSARGDLENKNWSQAFRHYPWPTFTESPWAPVTKPLSRSRVTLITSGGLSLPGQPIFREEDPQGDHTFRVIPGPGPLDRWDIHHGHYPAEAALEDYNTVFPLDILRNIKQEGVIGELSPRHISFMGYQTDADRFLRETAPEIEKIVRDDAADVVLLVPV